MTTDRVPAFRVVGSDQMFLGGTLFQSDHRAMLLGLNGRCILMDAPLADQLRDGAIPVSLGHHLTARGLAACEPDPAAGMPRRQRPMVPRFFMVDFGSTCNMACRYCFRDWQDSRTMTDDALRDICEYISAYCERTGVGSIGVQAWGGEPLLHLDQILKLTDWLRPPRTRVRFSVETNGLLLTEDVLDALLARNVEIGISLDGPAGIQDRQRPDRAGRGTHATVERNLRLALEKRGGEVGVVSVLTEESCQHAEDILEHMAALSVSGVKLNYEHADAPGPGSIRERVGASAPAAADWRPEGSGPAAAEWADALGPVDTDGHACASGRSGASACQERVAGRSGVTPATAARTARRVVRHAAELTRRGSPLVEANVALRLLNLLFASRTDICVSGTCGAGARIVSVDGCGNIFPCELMDHPECAVGSIYDDHPLEDVMSAYAQAHAQEPDTCGECPWRCFCRGGCAARRRWTADHRDPVGCAVNKAMYPALVELILEEPALVGRMLGRRGSVLA